MLCVSPSLSIHERKLRGMSLLEVMVVMVLIALAMAISIPALSALTGVQLRTSSNQIAGLLRDTHARAAYGGKTYRVIFDLYRRQFWVEEGQVLAPVAALKVARDSRGHVTLETRDERLEGIENTTQDEEEREKLRLLSVQPFKPVSDDLGTPQTLPGSLLFDSVWVEHLEEPAGRDRQGNIPEQGSHEIIEKEEIDHRQDQVAFYFFPGGYAENGYITLRDGDDEKSGYSIVLNALTGTARITDEPIRPEEFFEEEDDSE